tara:strand:- start:11462 stop:12100 length:639 start_codon:yes stop_codon:yes gene_type:complete
LIKNNIKICGIKDRTILDCCIKNNIKYFGLLFYEKSPRYINFDHALSLINYAKEKKIIPVGVFVNEPIQKLKEIIKKTSLKHIQLHGNEDDNYMQILKDKFELTIIKSIGINNKNDLKEIEKVKLADYYLFDYKPKIDELPGGNAKQFDWSILNSFINKKPWFISGGINVYNIKQILDNLIPYGIDISSGVEEKKGIKSCEKICQLMKKLNE